MIGEWVPIVGNLLCRVVLHIDFACHGRGNKGASKLFEPVNGFTGFFDQRIDFRGLKVKEFNNEFLCFMRLCGYNNGAYHVPI